MGTSDEPSDGIEPAISEVEKLAAKSLEFEKLVEKDPPKNRLRPSSLVAIVSTAPFSPEKGKGAHVESAIDHAATFPAYLGSLTPPLGPLKSPPAYTVVPLQERARTGPSRPGPSAENISVDGSKAAIFESGTPSISVNAPPIYRVPLGV